jgi:hypothetical protein
VHIVLVTLITTDFNISFGCENLTNWTHCSTNCKLAYKYEATGRIPPVHTFLEVPIPLGYLESVSAYLHVYVFDPLSSFAFPYILLFEGHGMITWA